MSDMINDKDGKAVSESELLKDVREQRIIENYARWYAKGPGVTAGGYMELILEKIGEDEYKVSDYSHSSHSATGGRSGLFSKEKEYFDNKLKEVKDLTFHADKDAMDLLCSYKDPEELLLSVKNCKDTVHFEVIDGKLGMVFDEHRGLTMDSANSALYQIGKYSKIIMPHEAFTANRSFPPHLSLYNEVSTLSGKDANLKDINFPKGLNYKNVDIFCFEECPENLQDIKVGSLSLKNFLKLPQKVEAGNITVCYSKEDVKIPSGWKAEELKLFSMGNVQIAGGEFGEVEVNFCSNTVISPKAKIGHLIIGSNTKNTLVPTSLGNLSNLSLLGGQYSDDKVYIFDKHPDDRVLFDVRSIKGIKETMKKQYGMYDRIKEVCEREIAGTKNENEFTGWGTLKEKKEWLASAEKKRQAFEDNSVLQEIYNNQENQEIPEKDKSLKTVYNDIKKKSGAVRADILAAAEIARQIDRL